MPRKGLKVAHEYGDSGFTGRIHKAAKRFRIGIVTHMWLDALASHLDTSYLVHSLQPRLGGFWLCNTPDVQDFQIAPELVVNSYLGQGVWQGLH